jgi:CRP-like cAMP-binding protein
LFAFSNTILMRLFVSVYSSSRNPVGNELIAALPQQEYERLLPNFEPVPLFLKQVLYEPNEPIEYAYFINSGASSMLNLMEDGQTIEAATIGKEGMVGVPLLLGTTQIPLQVLVQIPGDGLRMKAEVFKAEVYWGCPLHTLLLRYMQTLMNQISQTAACNRFHSMEGRCCRWLLMTHDRVESDSFPLTQEFLSYMLGVRRAGVSEVAFTLQRSGLIEYHRGQITIRDRKGLEASACECYRNTRREFERLLG